MRILWEKSQVSSRRQRRNNTHSFVTSSTRAACQQNPQLGNVTCTPLADATFTAKAADRGNNENHYNNYLRRRIIIEKVHRRSRHHVSAEVTLRLFHVMNLLLYHRRYASVTRFIEQFDDFILSSYCRYSSWNAGAGQILFHETYLAAYKHT